jgi:hypothetical protein
MATLLEKIHDGMKVYDAAQKEVGKVDFVQLSDENPRNPVPETAEVSPAVEGNKTDNLVQEVANLFDPDDIPEELRSRLLREGFVRVDAAGLFKSDRYIFPNQIQSVSGDKVMLKVAKDELLHRN